MNRKIILNVQQQQNIAILLLCYELPGYRSCLEKLICFLSSSFLPGISTHNKFILSPSLYLSERRK
jgi:hypothetical protein